MSPKVCRICLHSNITRTEGVHETLEDFHDELCDLDVFQNPLLTICPICECILKKCYNFKLKCQRSAKLLRQWYKKKTDFENLCKQIPPSSLGFSPHNPIVYEIRSLDIKPKLESSSLNLDEQAHNSFLINVKEESSDSEFEERESNDIILNDLCTKDNIIDDSHVEEEVGQEIISNNFNHTDDGGVKFELKHEHELSKLESLPDYFIHNNKKVQDINKLWLNDNECFKVIVNNNITKIITVKKGNFTKPGTVKNGNLTKPGTVKKGNLTKPGAVHKDNLTRPGTVKNNPIIFMDEEKLKKRVLELMEQGEFKDLGSNITIDKDMFVRMFEKCNLQVLKDAFVLPGRQGPAEIPRIKKLLRYLYSRYHPKYEAVFNIEYLNTEPKRLAEFEARRHGREYLDAEYKCNLCFKAFDAKHKLIYHNKGHEASQPHVCDICPMRSMTRKTLTVHYRNNHCAVYRCKQCPLVTYSFGVMVNHYDLHNGVEYACPICSNVFRTKSAMYNHRIYVHKTSHICPLCARSFVSDKGLYLHTKLKHRDESVTTTVSCETCSAKLATPEILQEHILKFHEKPKRNRVYSGRYKLKFKSLQELKQHRALQQLAHPRRVKVSGPDKPTRTCPVCLVEVPNTYRLALYRHYQAVHPQEPYTHADKMESLCEICGKGFRVHSAYMDHMNTHLGLRPYECTECEAKFPALHLLTVHKARHRPPRHKCKDCGKLFVSSANLFNHRRIHIGDRKFKCDVCFKGFLNTTALKEHVKGVHHQIRRAKKAPRKGNTKLDKIITLLKKSSPS